MYRVKSIISTHALTWRATYLIDDVDNYLAFLPTPSHGGRRIFLLLSETHSRFLPTPSHGGRPPSRVVYQGFIQFLPTPSHGGRLLCRYVWVKRLLNFYPRPHMEGDPEFVCLCNGFTISTHALTWRATGCLRLTGLTTIYFYPRPHMEGD